MAFGVCVSEDDQSEAAVLAAVQKDFTRLIELVACDLGGKFIAGPDRCRMDRLGIQPRLPQRIGQSDAFGVNGLFLALAVDDRPPHGAEGQLVERQITDLIARVDGKRVLRHLLPAVKMKHRQYRDRQQQESQHSENDFRLFFHKKYHPF